MKNFVKRILATDFFYMILLAVLVETLGSKNIDSDFWYSDASRHAMDGVYIQDLIRDQPTGNPEEYTLKYYCRYPALGIIYYPPLFAFVEAIFFLIFGISIVTARVTTLFFAAVGICFWFLLLKKIFNREVAFFASLIFILSPIISYWTRGVMLELPAYAMIFMTLFFFYRYYHEDKRKSIYIMAISLALALYTKQTTGFLIPLLVTYILLTGSIKKLLKKEVLISAIIFVILVAPLLIVTIKFGKVMLGQSAGGMGQFDRDSIENWTFYFTKLPKQLGLPILIVSCLGLVLTFLFYEKKKIFLMLLWLIWCYLTFSFISYKSARLGIFWTAPFCLFAILLFDLIPWKIRRMKVSLFLMVIFSISVFVQYSYSHKPKIKGYERAAKYISEREENRIVFFQGYHNGTFIFHVRKIDHDKKMIVFRGSKMLTSIAVMKRFGYEEKVKNQEDILKIFRDYGIKYIVIENKDIIDLKAFKLLRKTLKRKDKFKLKKTFPIETNIKKFKGMKLQIYEFREDVSLKKDHVTIDLKSIGKKIKVDIE